MSKATAEAAKAAEATPPAALAEEPQNPHREGYADGPPVVRFDRSKRQNYHLNAAGEKVYHDVPEGHAFNDDGVLEPVKKTGTAAEGKSNG